MIAFEDLNASRAFQIEGDKLSLFLIALHEEDD
jgi:hypothetical protein